MDSETAPCPWTPNSGLKSFRAQIDSIDYDPVEGLLNVQSPMKLFENTINQACQDDFRSPSRPTKRQRAPPSPATAMLLAAARVIDGDIPSNSPLGASPHNLLRDFDGSPGSFDVLGNLSPPSPARTPSRLLFSPKSEPRSMQRGLGVSPGSGMITSYDGLLADTQVQSHGIIGSIWKHSDEARRKTATSTARRPLLQHPTPHGKERLDDEIDVEPLPPDSTPNFKQKRPIAPPVTAVKSSHKPQNPVQKQSNTPSSSEGRKDRNKSQPTVRKTYSTAGRPRVRGEYKCGKCGYYPKKARHDCDEVKAKAAAGIPIAVQVAEQQQREERNGNRNRNRNNRNSQQHNISPSGTGTMMYAENERMSGSPIPPIKLNLGGDMV